MRITSDNELYRKPSRHRGGRLELGKRLGRERLGACSAGQDRVHEKGIYHAPAQSAGRRIEGETRPFLDRLARLRRRGLNAVVKGSERGMHQRNLESIAEPWAAQVVERYADRARPKMSETARLILLDHIMRRLASVIATAPAGDWPDVVNAALDAWEDEIRTSGPRLKAFDERAEAGRLQVAG